MWFCRGSLSRFSSDRCRSADNAGCLLPCPAGTFRHLPHLYALSVTLPNPAMPVTCVGPERNDTPLPPPRWTVTACSPTFRRATRCYCYAACVPLLRQPFTAFALPRLPFAVCAYLVAFAITITTRCLPLHSWRGVVVDRFFAHFAIFYLARTFTVGWVVRLPTPLTLGCDTLPCSPARRTRLLQPWRTQRDAAETTYCNSLFYQLLSILGGFFVIQRVERCMIGRTLFHLLPHLRRTTLLLHHLPCHRYLHRHHHTHRTPVAAYRPYCSNANVRNRRSRLRRHTLTRFAAYAAIARIPFEPYVGWAAFKLPAPTI